MANKRKIAIFNDKKANLERAKNLALNLNASNLFSETILFTRESNVELIGISTKIIPESCDNISKARNFINASLKLTGFQGFLHVVQDNVELVSNASKFLESIEKTMDVLDYDVWFNASCDPCNYVYSKFNPRLSISIDTPEAKDLGLPESINLTSHSNTAWVCYNFLKVPDSLLNFNENFSIPMFMIIEFLARRKASKKDNQPYFMNMYITVPEEVGVFKCIGDEDDVSNSKMAEEDKIFKSLNVAYSSDNNIDQVIEDLWAKINSKLKEKKN